MDEIDTSLQKAQIIEMVNYSSPIKKRNAHFPQDSFWLLKFWKYKTWQNCLKESLKVYKLRVNDLVLILENPLGEIATLKERLREIGLLAIFKINKKKQKQRC